MTYFGDINTVLYQNYAYHMTYQSHTRARARVHKMLTYRQFALFINSRCELCTFLTTAKSNAESVSLWTVSTARCSETTTFRKMNPPPPSAGDRCGVEQRRKLLPPRPNTASPPLSHNEKWLIFGQVLQLWGQSRRKKYKNPATLLKSKGGSLFCPLLPARLHDFQFQRSHRYKVKFSVFTQISTTQTYLLNDTEIHKILIWAFTLRSHTVCYCCELSRFCETNVTTSHAVACLPKIISAGHYK
jgi:hypothetical protein